MLYFWTLWHLVIEEHLYCLLCTLWYNNHSSLMTGGNVWLKQVPTTSRVTRCQGGSLFNFFILQKHWAHAACTNVTCAAFPGSTNWSIIRNPCSRDEFWSFSLGVAVWVICNYPANWNCKGQQTSMVPPKPAGNQKTAVSRNCIWGAKWHCKHSPASQPFCSSYGRHWLPC